MTLLLSTLLIVALLPYLAKLPLVWAMNKAGGYDNHNPRQQQARLEGFGQRCNAAHYNSFEALGLFSAAVICSVATAPVSSLEQYLAVAFVLSRLGYLLCYWNDWASARSWIWLAGLAMALAMMLSALQGI
ncbi:membrane protein [Arsukibacterium sp. MJ3]|uniref:MAPEG family protein n=1 Tax=Arsukibacterium sp. MJ3 TaxID=1632859 RepID=UPI0006273FF9|nr:MAPEG family protein [Arsukibacterium sp. MJ3]KKO49707.1 membrane protein [Arsukibacterium sp. MJ3]